MKHIDGDTFYGCDNIKSLYIRCPYSSIGSSFSCGSSLKEVFVQYDYEKFVQLFDKLQNQIRLMQQGMTLGDIAKKEAV